MFSQYRNIFQYLFMCEAEKKKKKNCQMNIDEKKEAERYMYFHKECV